MEEVQHRQQNPNPKKRIKLLSSSVGGEEEGGGRNENDDDDDDADGRGGLFVMDYNHEDEALCTNK